MYTLFVLEKNASAPTVDVIICILHGNAIKVSNNRAKPSSLNQFTYFLLCGHLAREIGAARCLFIIVRLFVAADNGGIASHVCDLRFLFFFIEVREAVFFFVKNVQNHLLFGLDNWRT